MFMNARIEWVIDDNVLGIKSGSYEDISIDLDYIYPTIGEIVDYVENEILKKYNHYLSVSYNENDNGDFIIVNIDDIIDTIKFEEFKDKTIAI